MFFIYRSFITNFNFFDVSFFPRMWNRKLEDEVDSPTKVSDSRKLEPDADNFSRSGCIQAKKNFSGNAAMSCNSKYGKNKFGLLRNSLLELNVRSTTFLGM